MIIPGPIADFTGSPEALRRHLNELVAAINRAALVGDGVFISIAHTGYGSVVSLNFDEVARRLKRAGGGGVASLAFGMITSVAGTSPPYVYSAVEAEMTSPGTWAAVEDGETYPIVYNVEEQGSGAGYVNPLLVDDVVMISRAPGLSGEVYVCFRSHYRGTY